MLDCGSGIYCVDAHYEQVEGASVYILRSEGRAAIVETASNKSLPYLLEAMAELGISRDEVDYVCVTHVHLDHAGGAGSYMREFPNAKLVVHPRGAHHMVNPTKLMMSVRSVYGDAETERMYGNVLPVPKERVVSASEGLEVSFGAMTLVCYETQGHAKHHIVLLEKSTGAMFTGDAFGVSYSWMRGKYGKWAFPTTSPVQFDPGTMLASIQKIKSLAPSRVFLTHFGELTEINENADLLTKMVTAYVAIAEEERGDRAKIKPRLVKYIEDTARERCGAMPAAKIGSGVLAVDLELNAQGLEIWYNRVHGQ